MHDISPKLFKKLNIFDGAKNRSRLRVRLRDMGGEILGYLRILSTIILKVFSVLITAKLASPLSSRTTFPNTRLWFKIV
jgi:hypothetical protein